MNNALIAVKTIDTGGFITQIRGGRGDLGRVKWFVWKTGRHADELHLGGKT